MGVRVSRTSHRRRTRDANGANHGVQGILTGVGSGGPMRKRPQIFLLTVIAAWAVATPGAQTPTFRTGIDIATFGVTVVDRKGEYLTDLNAEDFEIVEDGQKQAVKYFARGTDIENGPEMHVGLLFDTSGS